MKRSRGQTLVLFAITALVISLMVLMTISMGARAKEKMELQTAADATAYNSAVATARTFNAISIMNRVQAAHMISTLGTISLISWSTLYWKHADNAARLFRSMIAPYAIDVILNCLPKPPRPLCRPCVRGVAQLGIIAALASAHASKTRSRLRQDVELFSSETEPRWRAAGVIHEKQLELLTRLRRYVAPSGAAKQVLSAANLRAASEVSADRAGSDMSEAELDEAISPYQGPVAGADPWHIGQLLMASRGHPFIRQRREHGDWDGLFSSGSIAMRGFFLFAGGGVLIDRGRGRSYYDRTWTNSPSGRPYGPLAHDGQGSNTMTFFVPATPPFRNFRRCNAPLPAWEIATAIGLMGRSVSMRDAAVSAEVHRAIGHNVQHAFRTFPPFIDFNGGALGDNDNLHGQPKLVVAMARDVSSQEVFEPSVKMEFVAGSGAELTMAKDTRQIALGSGIVYYHRAGHSREPPNLFAPFWRGSLSRYTVDRPGAGNGSRGAFDGNTELMLNTAGAAEAAEAYRELGAAGYGGFE